MQAFIPLLIMAGLAGTIAGAMVAVSALLGPKKRNPVKDQPFECGLPSEGMAHSPVAVKFYMLALLFILFDVELAFLFPWAVVFRDLGWFALIEMLVFFVVVGAGFVYAWKIGALEWE